MKMFSCDSTFKWDSHIDNPACLPTHSFLLDLAKNIYKTCKKRASKENKQAHTWRNLEFIEKVHKVIYEVKQSCESTHLALHIPHKCIIRKNMRITTPDTLLRIYDYNSYIRFSAEQATSLVSLLVCFFTAATHLLFRLSLLQSIPSEAFDLSRCCSLVLQLPAGPLARCGSGRVRLYSWEAWSQGKNGRKKAGTRAMLPSK